jgi:predicted nucleic acid-binding protein
VHRLFLDANVLFTAAHNPDGKAAFLFDALDLKRWELLSSVFAIAETQRNIAAKYPPRVARLESLIAKVMVVAQPAPVAIGITLPEKDRPIYLAALACRASHLLTGDRQHFGRHMNRPQATGGVIIQTVAEFLAGC